MKKSKSNKSSIALTMFWVIFLVCTLVSIFVQSIISTHNITEKQGYQATTLIFDHLDDDNMGVYKYNVDGETYTYKESLLNKSRPKKGEKYEASYNINEPSEIKKSEKITPNYIYYGIIAFFAIGLILSLIDIKLGGTQFSIAFLCLLFFVASWVPLISLYSANSLMQLKSDLLSYLFPTILFTCFFGALITVTGWAMVVLLKESIQKIQKKASSKK